MLLIIIALLWLALLAPMVVRRFRDNGTEKSIENFHLEHEVLSRQEFAGAPPRRPEVRSPQRVAYETPRRPRLTVVHENDTYRSLETRNSWEEWSEDYDYEHGQSAPRRESSLNRYAAAYSDLPAAESFRDARPDRRRAEGHPHRSMKSRRRVMFTRSVLAAGGLSVIAYATGYSLALDLAALAWIGVVGFVSLALYAVSQGYLHESSLGLRVPQRSQASVETLYAEPIDELDDEFDDEFGEFYDPAHYGQWRRDSPSKYALG